MPDPDNISPDEPRQQSGSKHQGGRRATSQRGRRSFLAATATAASAMSVSALSAVASPVTQVPPQPKSRSEMVTTFRSRLLDCLGGAWPEKHDLQVRVTKKETRDDYTIEWVSYEVEPGDRVPAILLRPLGVSAKTPHPAIAVWHQHAGQWHLGKSEPAGLAGNPMHHTGVQLVKQGYVVLCPDALCFEERQDPEGKLKGGNFERFEFLRYVVAGKCMAWKNILDMRRAVDYLTSLEDVDSNRLGCYGHSMGSTHTWLVGPWEPRLRCLVGNCCLPTYKAIHDAKMLHCFPNFVPGLYEFGDTPDIAGLIAPRHLHLNFGEEDSGSPIKEVREGIAKISAAYAAAGKVESFTYFIESDTGHVLSEEMWARTRDVFREHM
jgi:dienelactone hydrolase